jgi:putative Ca2+/H+ antiporter (TMEM165/GDT1 family)
VGQVAVATLTAQHRLPLVIWAGATLALATKGLLAITLGIGLKKFLPQDFLRVVSVGLCLALGLVSTLQLIAS